MYYYYYYYPVFAVNEAKVEAVYKERSVLGEGPFYDQKLNELVWVDIEGKTINFLDLSTLTNRTLPTEDYVGAAVPCTDGKKLIASLGRRVVLVDRETGTVAKEVARVEDDKPQNRINDSKCDNKGRYWFGTMEIVDNKANQGSYYSFDGVHAKHWVPGITISNGIAISNDCTKMYYIDSVPKLLSCFDYNEVTGEITNRRIAIDFNKQEEAHGTPDGMTIDSEGKLWVAEFMGSCVCRWDPETGTMLRKVPLPAPLITSCCFGGPDYSTLYVTSASVGMTEEQLATFPQAGNIFAVTNLGVKGMPPHTFDDSKLV